MTYMIEINFGGFIGCNKIYTVDADSEEEAEELAFEEATEDLNVENIEKEMI